MTKKAVLFVLTALTLLGLSTILAPHPDEVQKIGVYLLVFGGGFIAFLIM